MVLPDLIPALLVTHFKLSVWENIGPLDVFLGLPLIYGLYKGLKNGLISELASIVALIAGIYGVMHFSYIASDYLTEKMSWDARSVKLTAFVITFLVIVFAVHLLGKFLTRLAQLTALGILNTIAGGVFGIVKVALILGALLIFFERANSAMGMVESETLQNSFLYSPIKDLGAVIFNGILESDFSVSQ
jgi:membrane protein required for colicin V production